MRFDRLCAVLAAETERLGLLASALGLRCEPWLRQMMDTFLGTWEPCRRTWDPLSGAPDAQAALRLLAGAAFEFARAQTVDRANRYLELLRTRTPLARVASETEAAKATEAADARALCYLELGLRLLFDLLLPSLHSEVEQFGRLAAGQSDCELRELRYALLGLAEGALVLLPVMDRSFLDRDLQVEVTPTCSFGDAVSALERARATLSCAISVVISWRCDCQPAQTHGLRVARLASPPLLLRVVRAALRAAPKLFAPGSQGEASFSQARRRLFLLATSRPPRKLCDNHGDRDSPDWTDAVEMATYELLDADGEQPRADAARSTDSDSYAAACERVTSSSMLALLRCCETAELLKAEQGSHGDWDGVYLVLRSNTLNVFVETALLGLGRGIVAIRDVRRNCLTYEVRKIGSGQGMAGQYRFHNEVIKGFDVASLEALCGARLAVVLLARGPVVARGLLELGPQRWRRQLALLRAMFVECIAVPDQLTLSRLRQQLSPQGLLASALAVGPWTVLAGARLTRVEDKFRRSVEVTPGSAPLLRNQFPLTALFSLPEVAPWNAEVGRESAAVHEQNYDLRLAICGLCLLGGAKPDEATTLALADLATPSLRLSGLEKMSIARLLLLPAEKAGAVPAAADPVGPSLRRSRRLPTVLCAALGAKLGAPQKVRRQGQKRLKDPFQEDLLGMQYPVLRTLAALAGEDLREQAHCLSARRLLRAALDESQSPAGSGGEEFDAAKLACACAKVQALLLLQDRGTCTNSSADVDGAPLSLDVELQQHCRSFLPDDHALAADAAACGAGFGRLFSEWRRPEQLLLYGAQMRQLRGEPRAAFGRCLARVLDGSFRKQRYSLPR